MAKTTQYGYIFRLDSRTQVFPYYDTYVTVYIGNDDGDSYSLSKSTYSDNSNAIAAWWRSKRLDFGDQYAELVDVMKTLDCIQLHYVDESADTPVTIAISDDGGENWIYRTEVIGTGDGRQKVKNFYFHDKDRITSRDFTIKILSADDDTTFTWTGIYVMFEPRGPYQEVG